MNLFREISTNKACCAILGLPSDAYDRPLADAEVNGSPLSTPEADRMGELARRLNEIGRMPKPARVFRARIEYARSTYVAPSAEELAASNAQMHESMAKDEARHAERFGSGVRSAWAGD